MDGQRLGRWSGLWATTEEITEDLFHVTESDERDVDPDEIYEGMFLHDKLVSASVFEVFLCDAARGRWFLVEV